MNGRCGVVDLPPILPFDRPSTGRLTVAFSLVWPGFADRIAAMSDASGDTPRNDSSLAATWDWCVLFVRTVAAPQAVFWYLTWNLVKPRPRRSRNA